MTLRAGAPAVVVSGMIAATPGQGGATWAVLQYVLGLRRLGCAVWFVEPVPDLRGAPYAATVMDRWGLGDAWALLTPDGGGAGLSRRRLRDVATGADVLLNVSGMLADRDLLDAIAVRVYLDLDPAFVQLWHAVEGIDMRFDGHTHFVTLSDVVGTGLIPDAGRSWIPTLPPVVLAEWPFAAEDTRPALTTVGHWRGYGSIAHDGVHLGQRAHSLRSIISLPARVAVPVEVALAIDAGETADLAALADNGWTLLDPDAVAGDPQRYRDFVAAGWAELGVAKSGYVVSDSGWFSDRSACYLASGRPVLAQATGFQRRLPTGAGLFAYRGVDDAAAAVATIAADYPAQRASARAVAEDHLDSDRVLTRLLDRVLS